MIITHVKAPIDQIVEQQIGRQFRTGRLVNPDLFVEANVLLKDLRK